MNRNRKTKTIAIVTAVVTLLSASTVFAATTSNSPAPTQRFSHTRSDGPNMKGDFNKEPNDGFNTSLDSLVTAGTITQAQEDAITSNRGERPEDGVKTVLDALVTTEIITQDQEDAIQTAMNANDGIKATLDSLVAAGTITQAQENAIQGSLD